MRIALLISGEGTTAATIITACKSGQLKNVEPVLVIASREGIDGIKRAIDAGMKPKDVVVVNPKTFSALDDFGQAILQNCEKCGVEFIGQYGWLCLTPANVIKKYDGMMTNQHPGPLDPGRPDFGGKGMFGKRVHAARLCFVKKTNRDSWSEATAQRVARKFDEGTVLKRKQVSILPRDDADALAVRMLPIEHEVQMEVLQDFANNQVKELTRQQFLVRPEEIGILQECKKEAIEKYPKG